MTCHKPLLLSTSQRTLLHASAAFSSPRLHHPSPQVHEAGHNWVTVPRLVRGLFTTALTTALSMVPGW